MEKYIVWINESKLKTFYDMEEATRFAMDIGVPIVDWDPIPIGGSIVNVPILRSHENPKEIQKWEPDISENTDHVGKVYPTTPITETKETLKSISVDLLNLNQSLEDKDPFSFGLNLDHGLDSDDDSLYEQVANETDSITPNSGISDTSLVSNTTNIPCFNNKLQTKVFEFDKIPAKTVAIHFNHNNSDRVIKLIDTYNKNRRKKREEARIKNGYQKVCTRKPDIEILEIVHHIDQSKSNISSTLKNGKN
ncbi:MAG TPA: hypothetical protein VK590_02040 [Saprospiraceae bacterium]|nr:hypothetical protein [Saprospiraceae bacterium]